MRCHYFSPNENEEVPMDNHTDSVTVRLPTNTRKQIDRLARQQHRSRTGQILFLLDQALGQNDRSSALCSDPLPSETA